MYSLKNWSAIDIILLPRKLFASLSKRVFTLYLGIAMLGFIDCLYIVIGKIPQLIFNRSISTQFYNITLFITLVLLLGMAHVVFFAVPMFDYFKKLRGKEIKEKTVYLIKFMKIYSVSHIPVAIIITWLFLIDEISGISIKNTNSHLLIYIVFAPIWISAIITRGTKMLFGFVQNHSIVVFLMVFSWNFMVSIALEYIREQWLVRLFV